jgi:hypothetical protein
MGGISNNARDKMIDDENSLSLKQCNSKSPPKIRESYHASDRESGIGACTDPSRALFRNGRRLRNRQVYETILSSRDVRQSKDGAPFAHPVSCLL